MPVSAVRIDLTLLPDEPPEAWVGQGLRASVVVRDVATGEPVAAAGLKAWVRSPASMTPVFFDHDQFTADGTGRFVLDVATDVAGPWRIRVECASPRWAASEARYDIRRSSILPLPAPGPLLVTPGGEVIHTPDGSVLTAVRMDRLAPLAPPNAEDVLAAVRSGLVGTLQWQDLVDAAEYDGKIRISDYGAVGDGVTDDTAALTAAVAAAKFTGRQLWSSAVDYLATGTIPMLHEVRHRGEGRIVVPGGGLDIDTDVPEDVVWDLSARSTTINRLYVSPAGDDANDGLTASRPLKTSERAFAILQKYKPLPGQWDIKLVAGGTYTGEFGLSGVWTENPIRMHGPALTKTGNASAGVETEARHSYENPVPTAIFQHPQAGVSGVGPSGRCISLRNGVQLTLKNVKFQGPWDIGLYGSGFCNLNLHNVHADLENDGTASPIPGDSSKWRLGGRNAVGVVFFVRYNVYGGRLARARIAINETFNCSRNIDVLDETKRNAASVWITDCAVGVKGKEWCSGHCDFATFARCATGLELHTSTANLKGSQAIDCAVGVVRVMAEIHNEGGFRFIPGGPDGRYPGGIPHLGLGMSSALQRFGWEASDGDPETTGPGAGRLRDGQSPLLLIGHTYAPTLTGTVLSGTVGGLPQPNDQFVVGNLCLARNVYNVQAARFVTKLLGFLPAGTTPGTILLRFVTSDVYMLDLTIPAGLVVPAGGATIRAEWQTVCIHEADVYDGETLLYPKWTYRVHGEIGVASQAGQLVKVCGAADRVVDLTDETHSVGVYTRIANAAGQLGFSNFEVWG